MFTLELRITIFMGVYIIIVYCCVWSYVILLVYVRVWWYMRRLADLRLSYEYMFCGV